ncbi:imelysin family protein [Psychrosphaera haliotis]|uniref:Peptidase M75 n=1 Tax=Psychrosphaera haliotis TaxID=555083 RepID=A0A6N8F8K1_9GAMM|nr:imelysin family protein [Psychrosphaera haliotis]MUH72915.1 peptidase M75 [Psychrosphaera haliotis]
MNTNLKHVKQAILIACTLSITAACSDSQDSTSGTGFSGAQSGSGSNNTTFDKQQMVNDLVDHVYLPAIEDVLVNAQNQLVAVESYCEALQTNQAEDPTLKTTAQEAWKNTMYRWQQVEMMQVGPVGTDESYLRNQIYSWPVDSQCAVDLDVSYFENGNVSGSPYDIKNRTANRKGLDALEHLLFTESLAHSCKTDSLGPKGWNDRPELERKVARCKFATEVASDLVATAGELSSAWSSENGSNTIIDFETSLKTANDSNSNSSFENIDAAINHLTDGLFYLDTITKDAKLGSPIGLITNSCGTSTCLNDIESNISEHSLANVQSNLEAMLLIFQGSDPATQLAFDDYLTAVDAESLANEMRADITAAIAAIESFETEGSFADAVQNNPARVQELYAQTKKVTDNLKSAFIVFLSLQLPSSSAGDAD